MKQLNSLSKPKVLLLVSALAAASVVGAQSTGYTSDSTTTPANNTAKMNAPSAASKPTDISSSPQPQSKTSAKKKTAKAATATKSAKAATATKSAKATTGTQQATNANPHNKVASANTRSTSRARATSGAKTSSNPGDTAYRNKLRNCQQQPAEQRESCLDQVIEQTQRS